MKAHKKDMIAAWARENGIKGYEHLDPQIQAKRRQEAIAQIGRASCRERV